MFAQRLSRLLPGRPQLLLILILAAVTVFAFGFVDLALTHQALLARRDQKAAKVQRLEEQNIVLQEALERQQQGQHLPDRAWQYFGQTPRGAGVILLEPAAEPAPVEEAAKPGAKTPFWVDLWRRLTQP